MVYPRVHGGNHLIEPIQPLGKGLSPRTRGKRGNIYFHRMHIRSIPAYTGETLEEGDGTNQIEVYPRVHGGNSIPNLIG